MTPEPQVFTSAMTCAEQFNGVEEPAFGVSGPQGIRPHSPWKVSQNSLPRWPPSSTTDLHGHAGFSSWEAGGSPDKLSWAIPPSGTRT
jgi:hypothetical protein